ncbi:hypothetical protein GCG54_00015286 [Colletotrichum gloeosporioides]|uniref:Integrase zinc-binding domain-containing protein n=1 Tax=Colletotrichum gloeosporioides TaxID=474922 RepID=A0A8H4FER7_COLGL|nr:uncharacterized protein GCG54_00015286 [Colletotrichum gloeosporioides]KAF3798304.1 hypothetical protein GCG54_00015286 [Colletotrichum gloeosporioides]
MGELVLILYDLFLFTKPQRNYGTYNEKARLTEVADKAIQHLLDGTEPRIEKATEDRAERSASAAHCELSPLPHVNIPWNDTERFWKILEEIVPMALSLQILKAQSALSKMPQMKKWLQDEWYSDMCAYLVEGVTDRLDRNAVASVRTRSRPYFIEEGILWHQGPNGARQRCLIRSEVSQALRDVHDDRGHFGPNLTRRRLVAGAFWPEMARDVVDFIAGCWPCAS